MYDCFRDVVNPFLNFSSLQFFYPLYIFESSVRKTKNWQLDNEAIFSLSLIQIFF